MADQLHATTAEETLSVPQVTREPNGGTISGWVVLTRAELDAIPASFTCGTYGCGDAKRSFAPPCRRLRPDWDRSGVQIRRAAASCDSRTTHRSALSAG
jgi:hypothetical protein